MSDESRRRLIVLTVDYEIFGNGSGDVRRHVIDPTERMARCCSQAGVPLTVFFEVEEYLAFDKYRSALRQFVGYDPAALIRTQIGAVMAAGHDVQLHLHPQWYGARFEAGMWVLTEDQATVDALFETEQQTIDYVRERKGVIQEMAAGKGKPVLAYRAGAFSAQPSKKLLGALAANSIAVDSSVVVGFRRNSQHGSFDYSAAPADKLVWKVGTDVAIEDPLGKVWEVPIASVPGRRFRQAGWARLKAKFSRNVPRQRQKEMVQDLGLTWNPFRLARFLSQKVPIKLDFHNISPSRLLEWIRSVPPPSNGAPDVVVLIGHTKEHIDDQPFAELLRLITADPGLRVVSFHDVAQQLCARDQADARTSALERDQVRTFARADET